MHKERGQDLSRKRWSPRPREANLLLYSLSLDRRSPRTTMVDSNEDPGGSTVLVELKFYDLRTPMAFCRGGTPL